MEEAFNQLKKEFDSLRVSFTECRTELALSKCKSDEKIAELQRQVAALVESNAGLVRRVNAVSPQKVAPPWDQSKKAVNISPNEPEKDAKKKESAPWDDEENIAVKPSPKEPWEQDSQRDMISTNKKSNCDESNEEKKPPGTEVKKAASESKPVSRDKDWNAICRELSSDDEEEEQERAPVMRNDEEEIRNGRGFVDGFIQLFNLYCGALESGKFYLLPAPKFPFEEMRNFEARANPNMHGYAAICQALSSDVRRLARRPISCAACNFTMSSFYLVLNHLTDNNHHECRMGELAVYHEDFVMISELLCACFYQFVARPNELQCATREEIEMAVKAQKLALKHTDRSRYRPSDDFISSYLLEQVAGNESFVELLTILTKYGEVKTVAKFIEIGECKQRICTKLRQWFAIKKNKQQFAAEFEKHMKGGIPYCSMCEQAFDSPTLYYRHVTSYSHSRRDQSIFTLIMLAWKGDEYWDPMIALVEE